MFRVHGQQPSSSKWWALMMHAYALCYQLFDIRHNLSLPLCFTYATENSTLVCLWIRFLQRWFELQRRKNLKHVLFLWRNRQKVRHTGKLCSNICRLWLLFCKLVLTVISFSRMNLMWFSSGTSIPSGKTLNRNV